MSVIDQIKNIGVVPVIALDDPSLAGDLAKALCDGGLCVAEVTFRVDNVVEVMNEMKKARPDMLLGAGTVVTKQQVDDAIKAGCEFVVSPGLNPELVKYSLSKNIVHVPGVATPSEVEQAVSLGLDHVKFFPAELNGGLAYIRALCAPYVNVNFMPTGGVSTKNLADYLSYEKVFAAGGTWIAKTDMIQNREFDKIEQLAKEAKAIVDEVR